MNGMSRPDGEGVPELAPEDLARLFAADGVEPADQTLSLPTIPAGAPVVTRLRRELQQVVATAPDGSPEKVLAARLVRGEVDLRSVLADPSLPAPTPDRVDPGLRAIIATLTDETTEETS